MFVNLELDMYTQIYYSLPMVVIWVTLSDLMVNLKTKNTSLFSPEDHYSVGSIQINSSKM